MKKFLFIFLTVLLLVAFPAFAETSASASRDIENQNLTAGGFTNITVTIENNLTQALSLQETIPSGWNLTRITDDASSFKASTNEWVWFNVGAGATKTVIYRLNVPSNATSGIYYINGNLSNSSGVIAIVSSENTINITVTPIKFNISGYKINDTNGNGVWDAGEQGIAGWNITLRNATTGAVIASNLTNAAGFYQFLNFAQGSYNVSEEDKAGWNHTNATFRVINLTQNITNLNFTNQFDTTPPIVTNPSANPNELLLEEVNNVDYGNMSTRINVTVTSAVGIASVTINLSSIGGSSVHTMSNIAGNVYSVVTNATGSPGSKSLGVNATDINGNSNTSVNISLKVTRNGDVNEDGDVDIADAMWLAKNRVGLPGFPINALASEVNGDATIDIADAMYIAKHAVGLPGFEKFY